MSLLSTFQAILGADRQPTPPGFIPAPRRSPNGRFITSKPNRRAELERAIAQMPDDLRPAAREFALTVPLTPKQRGVW